MADGDGTSATGDQGQQQQGQQGAGGQGDQGAGQQQQQQGQGQQGQQADPDQQLLDGARNPDAVKRALDAERHAAREAQRERDDALAKVKKFEDANKSEKDKLADEAAAAKTAAEEADQKYLRLKVGTAKGLPVELSERLKGADEKEMAADADRLLESVQPKPGAGSFDGGARQQAGGKQSMNDLIRRGAGRE